jgi:hypothetical protein
MQVPFNPTEIFWYHFGTMLHTPPPHTHTQKEVMAIFKTGSQRVLL